MTTLTLAQMVPGRLARIVAVEVKAEMQSRLAALGLVPGEVVEVVRSAPQGPCLVAFRASRLALQLELAQGISVRTL